MKQKNVIIVIVVLAAVLIVMYTASGKVEERPRRYPVPLQSDEDHETRAPVQYLHDEDPDVSASDTGLPDNANFVSSNLLPKDSPNYDASFAEFSPAKDLKGQNFVDSNKYAIGLQSQTLRNANLQLRSDPPIANTMECPSPWNNTTIQPETRRVLDIH